MIDIARTFIHIGAGGGAELVEVTPAYWSGGAAAQHYERVVGAVDFRAADDLHSSMQEMHPEVDEVLLLVSGALDVLVEESGGERKIALEPGQAAIVPRGAWHRLVMRQPGRLLFINNRRGIQSRPFVPIQERLEMQPDLNQIDLVVRDMEAALAFYRALGVEIPESAIWRTATGIHHVDVTMPGGLILHFDSPALAKVYDRGWRAPSGSGTRTVLSFKVGSRDEVDRIHDELVKLGHPSAQPPYDAFWGARYAIVEDPDGNHVGLMSPSDASLRRPPPEL